MNEEKHVALLIDAENVSAQYADRILEEVSNYGICSYKRIYGAWDRIVQTKWESQINKNSLKPMMLFNNIKGKTATDAALIIDAMDILYKGSIDVFCIVSSDSDFTALARRLMEEGVEVIGMGESSKATEALENACNKYVYIDLLDKDDDKADEDEKAAQTELSQSSAKTEHARKDAQKKSDNAAGNTPSKKDIEKKIKQIIMENEDRGRQTDLGLLGNELIKAYRNFDVRYYEKKGGGKYAYLKDFVSDYKCFQLTETEDKGIIVSLK
ncbi:MAG: NYN domain-containing protein [Eubacterium sp.]|jgi:uncharacterized protein (TIGR00288 family)